MDRIRSDSVSRCSPISFTSRSAQLVYPAKMCVSPVCLQCGTCAPSPSGHISNNVVHPAPVAAAPVSASAAVSVTGEHVAESAESSPARTFSGPSQRAIAGAGRAQRPNAKSSSRPESAVERQAHVRLTRGALAAVERALEATDLVRLRDRLYGRCWSRLLATPGGGGCDGDSDSGVRDDWTQLLSPGEQQRVALVRVLFHRPHIARALPDSRLVRITRRVD